MFPHLSAWHEYSSSQQWQCSGAAPRPLTTTSWSFGYLGYPTIKYPGSRGKKCSECGVNICLIAPHGPVVLWSPSTIVTMSHQSSDRPRPAQASTTHSGVSSPWVTWFVHFTRFSPFYCFPNFSAVLCFSRFLDGNVHKQSRSLVLGTILSKPVSTSTQNIFYFQF